MLLLPLVVQQQTEVSSKRAHSFLILFLALFKIVGGADSRALLFLSDCCRVEHHAVKKGSEEIPLNLLLSRISSSSSSSSSFFFQ